MKRNKEATGKQYKYETSFTVYHCNLIRIEYDGFR